MKRKVILAIVAILLLGLTSCGAKEDLKDEPDQDVSTPTTSDNESDNEVEEEIEDEVTQVQLQWNGTWYGVLGVNSGTGKYEDGFDDEDVYLVIDVNAEGKGTFSIYRSDMEEWAKGALNAYDYGLDVIDGEYLNSDEPMNVSEWKFRTSPLYEEAYTVTADYVENESDSFYFSMFFKPWGADWEEALDGVYPPGYYDYIEKVNNGEPSPFDSSENVQIDNASDETEVKETEDASQSTSGGAGEVSYQLVDHTLSLTLPSNDWVDKGITGGASGGVTTAHFYYVETHANAPRVDIQESFTANAFDTYKDRWENYEDIESKTIAGIEMKGRTYTAFGMQWIDYIAELGPEQHLCITIIDLDPESGETKELIDSITFS